MFESTDINQHWDGKYKGKSCSEGTYYFVLQAKSENNDYGKTGALMLVDHK
jgi:hypothetical protein